MPSFNPHSHITTPQSVVNIVLEYEGSNIVSNTFGMVPLVSTLFNTIKLPPLRALLTAIVSGQQDKAEAILKKDASLALEKLEEKDFVTAPTGHRFNLKPYQAALAVRDFHMAKMIKSYLDIAEADKQFNEQARGKMVNEEPIFKQLKKIADTIYYCSSDDIILSNFNATVKQDSVVEQELHKFWKLLDATLDEVITIEKKPFIPDRLLLKALQLYQNYYGPWFSRIDCENKRTLLFVQRVMGYDGIQRIMPVNYIQVCHYFPSHVKQILQYPSTEFMYRENRDQIIRINFYPLRPRSSHDFGFFIQGGSLEALTRGATSTADKWLSQLMEIKQEEKSELMPQNKHSRLWCW